MNKIILIFIAIFSILISGCSDIDAGRVTGKKYFQGWTQIMFIPAGNVSVPSMIYHPEEWKVYIDDAGETGWCVVSEYQYHEIKVGDWLDCK